MSMESATAIGLDSPFGWLGRKTLEGVAYLGGSTLLAVAAVRSLFRPPDPCPALGPSLSWQLARMLGMGFPLVALVHVAMGSFLSMQAYFGGTFVEGAGAVVGVGLIRNLAPLMTGITLAALLGARLTPELRARRLSAESGDESGAVFAPDAGRLTAVRVLAALVASPILALWGAAVGMVVGWGVGLALLGVTTHSFWHMFTDMLWMRDVVGLFVKGVAFGAAASLFPCFEGVRRSRESGNADPEIVPAAAFRAVCVALVVILFLNSAWFVFVYHAGPAFGPTLLTPPAPGLSLE